jgi:hypothetical protein
VRQQPALKIVVTSGYGAPEAGSPDAIAGAVYLRKPYEDQALEAALRSVTQSPV